jgi:hypothetical protein
VLKEQCWQYIQWVCLLGKIVSKYVNPSTDFHKEWRLMPMLQVDHANHIFQGQIPLGMAVQDGGTATKPRAT